MAGASDKARFYLEQSIPELQDLQRKQIFSEKEVTSIAKKRSDFEHKLNARGSQPSDYARYAEYEMNLESLRRKRVLRKGVKTNSHAGQRRIFFVLDRATRKFHGDVGLWMQHLEYARQQKASKKVSQIMTSVLRLHPTRPELWTYAANYAIGELGDMTEARSYMQRGLRFCKYSRNLWIEYARLEMIYMAKIAARRQILGLDTELSGRGTIPEMDQVDANIAPLDTSTTSGVDLSPRPDDAVPDALQTLSATPALSGAIPLAIFDAAMKQFEGDASLAEEIFDMAAEFDGVPCVSKIRHHIVDALLAKAPTSPAALTCFIREPVIGVEILSADFPRALNTALDRLRTVLQDTLPIPRSSETTRLRIILSNRIVDWILPYLDVQALDQDIRRVLVATLKKLIGQYRITFQQVPSNGNTELAELATKLLDKGLGELAKPLVASGMQMSPNDSHLLSLSKTNV